MGKHLLNEQNEPCTSINSIFRYCTFLKFFIRRKNVNKYLDWCLTDTLYGPEKRLTFYPILIGQRVSDVWIGRSLIIELP